MAASTRGPARHMQKAVRLALFALLACGLTLLAPRQATAQNPHGFIDSGTVNFVTDQSPSDLDPANNEVAGSDVVARSIAEPLVAPDGSSLTAFKPVLA